MKKVAVIGAGISGVSVARMLKEKANVTVYEKKSKPGGLIGCDVVDGNLYHKVGGHVFNSKIPEVLEWFWQHFDRDQEFLQATRNAKIYMQGQYIGYPLEDHLHMLPPELVKIILHEMLTIYKDGYRDPFSYPHFEAFLKGNFGETLYELYFKPYNQKIWRVNLQEVAMEWLEGKLPMPNLEKMLFNNIVKQEESEMVHATFFYPKKGGSQFIIDRLAEGLTIKTDQEINEVLYKNGKWHVAGESYDHIVYTGDVRRLNQVVKVTEDDSPTMAAVKDLRSHGTTNFLCESDPTDLSWLYLPEPEIQPHRIIYTGNFSEQNNNPATGRISCTVEFTGNVNEEEADQALAKLPGNLRRIASNTEPNSYVIQTHGTREKIQAIKDVLEPKGFFLTGRFAEWEYYNMDKCMEGAMRVALRF